VQERQVYTVMLMRKKICRAVIFMALCFLAARAFPAPAAVVVNSVTVTELKGPVYEIKGTEKIEARQGMKLLPGDILETGSGASATVVFLPGKALLRMNQETTIVSDEKWKYPFYTVERGQVRCLFKELPEKKSIYCGDAFIHATDAEIDVLCLGKEEYQLYVLRGRVWWDHTKFCTKKVLQAGEFLFWTIHGIPSLNKEKSEAIKERVNWLEGEK
jgi:hypothetical protein